MGQQVLRVRVGRAGTLRVGTPRSGLQERDLQGVFHAVGPQNVPVAGISENLDGSLWVTHPITGFRAAENLRAASGGPEGRGFFLFHDSKAQLWVGTLGQGLWRVRDTTGSRPVSIEVATTQVSDGIWCVFEDREGNIWVGTNRGLVRLFRHTMTPVVDYGLVRSVATAAGGGVWVGTAGGVIRLTGLPATVSSRVMPRGGSDTTSLDTDRTGSLWIATGQTASRVIPERGGPRSSADRSCFDPIRSIAGDGRGGLWLRTPRLHRWATTFAALGLPADVSRAPISFVHMDRRQRLWVVFENSWLAWQTDAPACLLGAEDGWIGIAHGSAPCRGS